MNKDAVLASVLGFGIGLLITGGILLGPTLVSQLANRQLQGTGQVASSTDEKTTPKTTPAATDETPFTIESPTAESILTGTSITVKGTAPDTSLIIAANETEEAVTTAIGKTFQTVIAAKEGKNILTITNISQGKSTVQRVVVYVKK